jgi:hypothetical protein
VYVAYTYMLFGEQSPRRGGTCAPRRPNCQAAVETSELDLGGLFAAAFPRFRQLLAAYFGAFDLKPARNGDPEKRPRGVIQ